MESEKRGLDLVRVRMIPDRILFSSKPVSNPEEAVNLIIREFRDLDREVFMVMNLTCHMQVINLDICSVGTLTYTVVHPRDIFKTSILSNAANVMLIHPSQEDLDMTERMVSAGRVLGIDVVDHLIIGPKDMSYTSLRERGVMEFPEKGWKELEQAADRQPEHIL